MATPINGGPPKSSILIGFSIVTHPLPEVNPLNLLRTWFVHAPLRRATLLDMLSSTEMSWKTGSAAFWMFAAVWISLNDALYSFRCFLLPLLQIPHCEALVQQLDLQLC